MSTNGEGATAEISSSVNVVKKQTKKTEKRTEVHKKSQNGGDQEKTDVHEKSQNGSDQENTEVQEKSQNGDEQEENDADLTVQIATKKTGTKTETRVETTKKTLADGTVEEITVTTTTKTSPDGKKEITTKTQKKIIPKETEEEEEYEEEEEDQKGGVTVQDITENGTSEEHTVTKTENNSSSSTENKNTKSIIVKNAEHSESTETTTKKVMFVENTKAGEDEEQEDVQENVQTTEIEEIENEEEVFEEDEEKEVEQEETKIDVKKTQEEVESKEKEEEEEEIEVSKVEKSQRQEEEEEEEEYEDEELEEEEEYEEPEETETVIKTQQTEEQSTIVTKTETDTTETDTTKTEVKEETTEETKEESTEEVKQEIKDTESKPVPEPKTREIPVLFDKVEDIEIKPIGNMFTKSHTETTEICTNKTPLSGPPGLATEMQRVENITVTSKTTKILDREYEQLKQQGIPTQKTYFAPGRDRVLISPSKVYEPTYPTYPPPQPPTERRHSLLLERLSMERQMPPQEQYQNYQTYENQTTRQWSQEPQSEILSMPNVKPSAISKNQQWYNQSRTENEIYNNTNSSSTQSWSQPTPQPVYQAPVQPPQQPQYQPQPPYYEPQPQPEPQYQYQPPKQTNFTNNYTQNYSNTNKTSTNTLQHQHSFPSYAPKQTTWNNNQENYSNYNTQYSYQNNTVDGNQKTQQYTAPSGYVPPPWEQDSSYSTAENTTTSYYQTLPSNDNFKPNAAPAWNSNPSNPVNNKFTKPTPLAYVPPAPNQSFVKPVKAGQTKQTGRNTYYSEYERRYITVPESSYVPETNKFPAQPNPSPQYYYDNNEQEEKQEHAWRKELREFTEKSTTQYQGEQSDIKPPWEGEKYVKSTNTTYTSQPSWTQTLRPRSTYETSYESSEYVTSEYPKNTNTLGRSRPLSYIQSNEPPRQDRSRGVSVDRFNANVYQSPIGEHPPVQSHTLTPMSPGSVPHSAKNYHNPNVPAYHNSRASAEPREQSSHIGTRVWADSRASPVQSRSFKYLQWITGTDE